MENFEVVPTYLLQPTPPHGDEQKAMQQIVDRENYNPHHPQGDEQVFPSLFLFFMHFNPHPRRGMNYAVFTAPPVARSFQPTPPQGDEHQQYLFEKKRMEITTHTPVWG